MENIATSVTTAQPESRSFKLKMTLILGALTALGPLSIDMYLPALPGLAKDLGSSPFLVQLSLTFFLLGLAIGQLFAGPLTDTKGRRGPLLWGIVVFSVSSLLCALSPTIWVLIVLRFIQGLAGAAGMVISRAIIRDLYSGPEMTKFGARLMLVFGAAPVLAPIAGGQLLRLTSWPGVFFVLAVVGVGIFFAVSFGIPETLPAERRSRGGIKNTLSTLRGLVSDRVFMGYALSQGFVFAGLFAYISGSPFVMQNIYGVTPQMFSLLFAINSIGMIIAGQVAGRLAGQVSDTKLFVTGLGMALIGGISLLLAVVFGAGLFFIVPPLLIVVSSVGVVGAAGFTLAMQNQGQAAGSASGVLGVLNFIFGALVAPMVGLGGSHTAIPLGIVIFLTALGAVSSYFLLVHRPTAKA